MSRTHPISKRMFWTIVAVLGVAVAVAGFGLRYSAPSAEAAKITIDVGNFWFCSSGEDLDCERKIDVGDTVSWQFVAGTTNHTTTSNDGFWNSGATNSKTFEYTFDSPGTFDYRCTIHPSSMQGRIIVNGPAPTETLEPSPTPQDTPVPTATDVPAPTATETAVPTTTPTPDETPVLTPPPPSVTPTRTGTFVAPTSTITPTPTTFGPTLTATPPAGTVGDASNNGTVDSIDALLVLQFVAALLPDLPSEMNADANQNGTVNAIDATLILQFIAGLIGMLPP